MIWIKKETVNSTVTDFYLETIGNALESLGCQVQYTDDLRLIPTGKNHAIVVSTAPDAMKAYSKCKKIIYWAQGVWPEESLMRNGSKLRFFLSGVIEKWALKKAAFVFFVSEAMKEFYEKKYSLNFDGRYYIMPCSNEELHDASFFTEGKYTDNVFCYAGGTSVWQCFEETIALYKKIEEKHQNTKLLLLVKDKEVALAYIQKYNVQNYEINFVPVSKLPDVLKSVKFGFVLREASAVNYVATPTKVLTYLANGLIPIYSSSLEGIHGILQDSQFCVRYGNGGDISAIEKYMTEPVHPQEVLQDYETIYKRHYARETHLTKLRNTLAVFR